MEPEDAFDAVHLQGAALVEAFLADLEAAEGDEAKARRTADIAYLFVEYLANTFPRPPREATERDAWVFLFDYCITEGPFAGQALEGAPEALGIFVDWLARRERVREAPFLRAVCSDGSYFRERLDGYRAIARAPSAEAAAEAADRWWADLDLPMRLRGLAPDPSLIGGPEAWGAAMGPIEAAVFDAVCLLLTVKARALRAKRIEGERARPELLATQRAFMKQPNPGLGDTPFAAILKERERLA